LKAERDTGHAVRLAPRRPEGIFDFDIPEGHGPQLKQGLLCGGRNRSR